MEYIVSEGNTPDKTIISGNFDIYIDDFATRMFYLIHYHNRTANHDATHFSCRVNIDETIIQFSMFSVINRCGKFYILNSRDILYPIIDYDVYSIACPYTREVLYFYTITLVGSTAVIKSSLDDEWEIKIMECGAIYVPDIFIAYDYVAILSPI